MPDKEGVGQAEGKKVRRRGEILETTDLCSATRMLGGKALTFGPQLAPFVRMIITVTMDSMRIQNEDDSGVSYPSKSYTLSFEFLRVASSLYAK